jgi:hypothetical protein
MMYGRRPGLTSSRVPGRLPRASLGAGKGASGALGRFESFEPRLDLPVFDEPAGVGGGNALFHGGEVLAFSFDAGREYGGGDLFGFATGAGGKLGQFGLKLRRDGHVHSG